MTARLTGMVECGDEPLPRETRERAAARGRRRHGDARVERGRTPALPRGSQHPGTRERPLAPSRVHPRRRRHHRDEHVRREPAQARRALPRGRRRGDQRVRGEDRPRRARGVRRATYSSPARSGPLGGPAKDRDADLRRAGTAARGPRRRPLHDRDVLRARRARHRDPRSARESPRCRSSACSRSTRTRRRSAASPRSRRPRALAELDVAAIGANHGVGPPGGAPGDRADGRERQAARRAPERRVGEPCRRARHLPARDAGVLRRVRRARTRARRTHHRRLLRDDADADRRDPERGRRGSQPAHAARRTRARDRRLPDGTGARDPSPAKAPRRGVRRLRRDRPSARRECARDARAGARRFRLPGTSTSST